MSTLELLSHCLKLCKIAARLLVDRNEPPNTFADVPSCSPTLGITSDIVASPTCSMKLLALVALSLACQVCWAGRSRRAPAKCKRASDDLPPGITSLPEPEYISHEVTADSTLTDGPALALDEFSEAHFMSDEGSVDVHVLDGRTQGFDYDNVKQSINPGIPPSSSSSSSNPAAPSTLQSPEAMYVEKMRVWFEQIGNSMANKDALKMGEALLEWPEDSTWFLHPSAKKAFQRFQGLELPKCSCQTTFP